MAKRLDIQLYNEDTKASITLPVNPTSVSMPTSMQNQTYSIVGQGEINIMGNRNLQRVTLSNFLPEDNSIFSRLAQLVGIKLDAISSFLIPYNLNTSLELLKTWEYNENTVRVIISDYLNIPCKILSFTPEILESTKNINYTLELIEDREIVKKETSIIKNSIPTLAKRAITQLVPSAKLVTGGQDLYNIATQYYQDGSKFSDIAEANNITDYTADLTGETLEMPDLETIS